MKHSIMVTGAFAPPDGGEETDSFSVQDGKGGEVTLTSGTAFETDDAEVAAVVADGAVRAVGKSNVRVVTDYGDDEAASASAPAAKETATPSAPSAAKETASAPSAPRSPRNNTEADAQGAELGLTFAAGTSLKDKKAQIKSARAAA